MSLFLSIVATLILVLQFVVMHTKGVWNKRILRAIIMIFGITAVWGTFAAKSVEINSLGDSLFTSRANYEDLKNDHNDLIELTKESIAIGRDIQNRLDSVSTSLDTARLNIDYPLGYAIAYNTCTNITVPYKNNRLFDLEIYWQSMAVKELGNNGIEFKLPEISEKCKNPPISSPWLVGQKIIGPYGGYSALGIFVNTEILEINSDGIIWLVGFKPDPAVLAIRSLEISDSLINVIHEYYNKFEYEKIWNLTDLEFKSSGNEQTFIDFSNKTREQLGDYLGLIKGLPYRNVKFDTIPVIVNIGILDQYENGVRKEFFTFHVIDEIALLHGWHLLEGESDTLQIKR